MEIKKKAETINGFEMLNLFFNKLFAFCSAQLELFDLQFIVYNFPAFIFCLQFALFDRFYFTV